MSYRFGVIAAYCSNFGYSAFLALFGGLEAKYDDHLRFILNRIVGFLLALIELFSLGVKAEALRANMGSKSAISLQIGPFDPTFAVEVVIPYQLFFFSEN